MEATVKSCVGSSQTLDKHFEKEVSTELLKFKCSIVNLNHTSKDTPRVLGTVEKQSTEMTQPLSAASPQTSQVRLFVSGLSFVFLGILSFVFSLNSADCHSKIYGNSWPVLPPPPKAKHINKTYMYFNLLLVISAADKKQIKTQQKKTNTHFSTLVNGRYIYKKITFFCPFIKNLK